MQDNSDLEESNKHRQNYYYHPLPASDSSTAKTEIKREGSYSREEEDAEVGSHEHKPAGLNKYALASAVLASTNSILLGYGEHNIIKISNNEYWFLKV